MLLISYIIIAAVFYFGFYAKSIKRISTIEISLDECPNINDVDIINYDNCDDRIELLETGG